jgi:hypothetical protein
MLHDNVAVSVDHRVLEPRMSTPSSSGPVVSAPFAVSSVHFDFLGGQAIGLVDPATPQTGLNPGLHVTLAATPEWVTGGRSELAAYLRKTRPHLRVVFLVPPGASGTYPPITDPAHPLNRDVYRLPRRGTTTSASIGSVGTSFCKGRATFGRLAKAGADH